jgi:RNA polymerase sigma-70 factor, ECF subfamily
VKDSGRRDIHEGEEPSGQTRPAALDAAGLFRRHAAWVAAYVTRLGFRGHDVDDIVQETFLVAHRRGGFREGPARPTTWLAEIALRVAMASRRKQRRAPVADAEAVDAAPSQAGDPLAGAMHAEALVNVQRALDSMDLERRALFVLFELEGESCESLAAGFGVPIGTIYSRLHAARAAFLTSYSRLTADPKRRGSSGASA